MAFFTVILTYQDKVSLCFFNDLFRHFLHPEASMPKDDTDF